MGQQCLKNKILEEIESKNLKVKPRWYFNLIKCSLIMFLFALFLITCLSLGIIIYIINEFDPGVSLAFGLKHIVSSLPYFWLVLAIASAGLCYLLFIDIKNGYRYSFSKIFSSFIVICIFFGGIAYASGVGEKTEKFIEENVPYYETIQVIPDNYWLKAEDGFISGEVQSFDSEKNIINIIDKQKRIWQVASEKPVPAEFNRLYNEANEIKQRNDSNEQISPRQEKQPSPKEIIAIKAIGRLSNNTFKAKVIKPLKIMRQR